MRACQPKRCKEKRERGRKREREHAGAGERLPGLWLLFFMVFFSPPTGPDLCKLGKPGVPLVPPEVLTLVLGPSFVLFSWAFPFLVFSPAALWSLHREEAGPSLGDRGVSLMIRAASGVVPVPLCHREVSTRFPHWLMFLGGKKAPEG